MTYILTLCFSLLLTSVLIPPSIKIGLKIGMVDMADARKVHSGVVTRSGGLAIVVGAMVPLLCVLNLGPITLGIVLGAACIFVMGVIDDLQDLDCKLKFLGQITAAIVTIGLGGLRFRILGELWPGSMVDSEWVALPLSFLFLVATINSINLADGLDGLAAGICLLIFTAAGLMAYMKSDSVTLGLCACLFGACIGFLRFNTYPAAVFMGDTGSQFLGFTVGVAMMLLTRAEFGNSPVLILYIIGIPVFDTALVIIERLIERRPIFKPDMNHLHHKLLKIGLQQYHAVGIIYATQLGMILLGWRMRNQSSMALLVVYLSLTASLIGLLMLSRMNHISCVIERDEGASHGLVNSPFLRRSRVLISQLSWSCLLGTLLIFYFCSPFWARPIAKDVGLYSVGFTVAIIGVRCFRRRVPRIFLKLSAYFVAVYYILVFDLPDHYETLWDPEKSHVYWFIFVIMGISYLAHLVSTFDEIPVVTMDYLLLAMVILTFALPVSYLIQYHLHSVATKILIVFLSFELLCYKLENKSDLLTIILVQSLGLNFVLAFWPWLF